MKTIITVLILLAASSVAFAQSNDDVCHVYVVDVAVSSKALDNFRETGNPEADAKTLSAGQTLFPEFRTSFQEENLTTKHYPFPNSKLIITASVYYTDESMPSYGNGKYDVNDQSILIGIIVSKKAQESALTASTPNSAITEVTYDEWTNKVRAKQYVKVRGRLYLVGIECDCAAKRKPKWKRMAKPNNSFNSTALSLPFMMLVRYIAGCRSRRAAD